MLGLIFSIALLLINKLVHLMMFYVIKIQFHKQFDWRRIVKKTISWNDFAFAFNLIRVQPFFFSLEYH